MEIVSQSQSINVKKPTGTTVWYYLFNEYELHYNEIAPGTTQEWHSHAIIDEVIFIIEGQLKAEWIEKGVRKSRLIIAGDLVKTGKWVHTFTNVYSGTTKFIVLKMIAHGKDNREAFKFDKRVFSETELNSMVGS